MKEEYKTIDYNWLIKPTGDPFADIGGLAIRILSQKFPEKGILDLIDYLTKIYVEKWDGKLNAFFLNSKITQPAFQGQRKISETLNYFERLINETEPFEYGFCRITGKETKLFQGGRDNTIMTGSGTFINYHHNFQKGILISKEAIIRIHFVPFACFQLQGKIALLQSNNYALGEFIVKQIVNRNLHEIAIGISEGIAKSDMGKPANAIFNFVDEAINQLLDFADNEDGLPSLTLYHFTNFGANPEIQIHQLPAKVFVFYRTCFSPKFKEDWIRFIRSHYFDSKHKGGIYNWKTGSYEITSSKELVEINQGEYMQWYNVIYNKLLNGESIRPEILRWSRKFPFNFKLVEIYQINIIGMKQATISKIKELAAFLVKDENVDNIEKRIKSLDKIKNAAALRRFFLKDIIAKNYTDGNKDSIIDLEDYLNYLCPDGSYWGEIRDLLLIAVYQELHERELVIEELTIESDYENEN